MTTDGATERKPNTGAGFEGVASVVLTIAFNQLTPAKPNRGAGFRLLTTLKTPIIDSLMTTLVLQRKTLIKEREKEQRQSLFYEVEIKGEKRKTDIFLTLIK